MEGETLQAIFGRSPPESFPDDANVVASFVSSTEQLSKDNVIELRKDILNQAYRMIAIKDISGPYLLTLLTALKKLAKHPSFGDGINLKVYCDMMASLILWCCSERVEETTACLTSLISKRMRDLGVLTYSLDKLRGKGIADAASHQFYNSLIEIVKNTDQDKMTVPYVIDVYYWLLITTKDEDQLDYFSFKEKICSNSLAVFLFRQLRPSNQPELIMKACKIIELMTDVKDFFFYILKNRGLDDLADVISADIDQDLTLQVYTYFLKGLKLGVFSDKSLLKRLQSLALRDIKYVDK